MKIYTQVQKNKFNTYVGVVLVGDKDQIYMMNGCQLQTNDELSAHLYGIKRALSFVKFNKPLHANDNIEYHTSIKDDNISELKSLIDKDEYIGRFLSEKNIQLNIEKSKTDFDNQMNLIAQHQIKFYNNTFRGIER